MDFELNRGLRFGEIANDAINPGGGAEAD